MQGRRLLVTMVVSGILALGLFSVEFIVAGLAAWSVSVLSCLAYNLKRDDWA